MISRERDALKDKLFNNPKSPSYQNRDRAINVSKLRTLCPGSKIIDYCKQHIGSLVVLARRVQSAVHLCADVRMLRCKKCYFQGLRGSSRQCYASNLNGLYERHARCQLLLLYFEPSGNREFGVV
jgi:hypothetical protein